MPLVHAVCYPCTDSPCCPCSHTSTTLASYIHGGYTLGLNSLLVPYFKASKFLGATLVARHSLEVGSWAGLSRC